MANPIRVALLTAKMSPSAGGLSVSVPGLAHGLDMYDDIEMHVLGTQDPAAPEAAMEWGPRVQAFRVAGPPSLQFAPDMALALAKLDPDVIDVQGLWTWTSRVNLIHSRRHNKPYIVTPRGMLDPWARRNSSWKKNLFAAFTENAHLRNAHCIRATADMEAKHFRDIGLRAPIAVVPNAISLPELSPRPANRLRRLLFLSRIHPKKGAGSLLLAWSKLQESYPNWELVIAGIDENRHEAELKVLARNLNLQRLTFFGPVHGAAKEALYRSSDVFVLPTHAENFGLVVAEALAQEVPVITTTNAPWSGLQEKGCGWWIPLNDDSLVDSMADAMSRPQAELRAMGSHGRAWIEADFAPESVAAKMRDVYLWSAGRGERPNHVWE